MVKTKWQKGKVCQFNADTFILKILNIKRKKKLKTIERNIKKKRGRNTTKFLN